MPRSPKKQGFCLEMFEIGITGDQSTWSNVIQLKLLEYDAHIHKCAFSSTDYLIFDIPRALKSALQLYEI